MSSGSSVRTGLWRHHARLPVRDLAHVVSLGEGDTPTVDVSATIGARIGLDRLWVKAEDRNPTGSFKARIASVAFSLVRERGLAGVVGTSSGNGGAAAAAYAAAAGSQAVLFTLADIVPAKLREIAATGAVCRRVSGVGHDAASTREVADLVAAAAAASGHYPMLTGFHYAPEAMTGVQTIAYELAEQVPDATRVYAPVGGGGLLTGLFRGYTELGSVPVLVGVQPYGVGSLPAALDGHLEGITGAVTSRVSGLQMAVLYDADGAVAAIADSGGHAVAPTDEDIAAAQRIMAEAGLLVEPAGATALAGVIADLAAGRLCRNEPVVVIATGAGHKDLAALDRLVGDAVVPTIDPDQVEAELRSLVTATPASGIDRSSPTGRCGGRSLVEWQTERVTSPDGSVGVTVHRCVSTAPGPRLLVLGGVHGNEIGGILGAGRVAATPLPLMAGSITVIPVTHEAAHSAFVRTGPADGLDLARTFPGDPLGSPTEQVAAVVAGLIAEHDGLIDLHTSSQDADLPLFAGTLSTGPQGEANLAMINAFGLDTIWSHPEVGPGRTLTVAEELGIPAMYVESPRGGVVDPVVVEQYANGVLRVAQSWGLLPSDTVPTARQPRLHLTGNGNTDTFTAAEVDGWFAAEATMLDPVHAGDRVGVVLDHSGHPISEVRAAADGHIVFLRTLAPVTAGTPLVSVCPPASQLPYRK